MRRLSATEYQIHCAIVDILKIEGHRDLIWFHVPNGEERADAIAAKLKRMGVVSGVADFAMTLPDGRSAYMEVKTDKGKLSPEQTAFRDRCMAVGAPYEIVRSLDGAREALKRLGALRVLARAA